MIFTRKCRLKKKRQRKALHKNKRQVLPVGVPEGKLRIYLAYFLPPASFFYFVLSGLNTFPPLSISLFATIALPHLPTCLCLRHLSSPFMCLTPPPSTSCLSFCHFDVFFIPDSSFSLPLRFHDSASTLSVFISTRS